MLIDKYEHQKYVVLSLTLVKNLEFLVFHEVLVYQYINELMKYWVTDINKSIVNLWKLIAYLESTFMNYPEFNQILQDI